MLRSSVFRTVDFCTRHAWWVIVCGLAVAVASTVYAARHFAIKTDVTGLFPHDLPWSQRAPEYTRSFPQPDMLVVVDAPTPELVETARTELTQALALRRSGIGLVAFVDGAHGADDEGRLSGSLSLPIFDGLSVVLAGSAAALRC